MLARGLGRIGHQNARIRSIFALLWLLAGLALFTGSASADPSPAFYSGSASCNNDVATVAGPTVTSPIPDVVARIQASSNFIPASGANDPLEPSDVQWDDLGAVAVGSDPSFSVYCVSGSVNVSFFDAPTAPTSYTGATTPGDFDLDDSTLVFVVASDDYYEAIVDVTQGAIQLECTNGNGIFTSTGICDLGSLSSSDYEISDNDIAVSALDGPQAQWTITIEPIPVALSAVTASPKSGFTGSPTTISYTVSGNASVTAGVYNSSNELVDDLASNLAVSQGKHSLTWGGTGQSGSALPAGGYTVALTSTDSQGNVSTQSVPFTITPVAVSAVSAQPASPLAGNGSTVNYTLNGTAQVTATVTNSAGAVVSHPVSAHSEMKGAHTFSWSGKSSHGRAVPAGRYTISISAADAGGDVSTGTTAVTVKPVQLSHVRLSGNTLSAGQTGRVDFSVSGPASVTGALMSQSGKTIRKFSVGSASKAGSYYFDLKAIAANGKPLPSGRYRIRLSSTDAAGDQSKAVLAVTVVLPRVYAANCGTIGYLEFMPSSWSAGCTAGSAEVSPAHWQVWNATEARAVGESYVDNCEPDCAQPSEHAFYVSSVVLSHPKPCPNDPRLLYFSVATWSITYPRDNPFHEKPGTQTAVIRPLAGSTCDRQ